MILSERASQEEQNGANFSFTAPPKRSFYEEQNGTNFSFTAPSKEDVRTIKKKVVLY